MHCCISYSRMFFVWRLLFYQYQCTVVLSALFSFTTLYCFLYSLLLYLQQCNVVSVTFLGFFCVQLAVLSVSMYCCIFCFSVCYTLLLLPEVAWVCALLVVANWFILPTALHGLLTSLQFLHMITWYTFQSLGWDNMYQTYIALALALRHNKTVQDREPMFCSKVRLG